MDKQLLAKILTYAGALPFLGAVVIPILQPDFLGLDYQHIILTYGAVIASFIAGIHWGIYLFKNASVNLFIHSNIIALLAWFAAVAPIAGGAGVLIFCFLYLLFIDKRLADSGIIEPWYMRMRVSISVIVVLALIAHILFHS